MARYDPSLTEDLRPGDPRAARSGGPWPGDPVIDIPF